MKHNSLLMVTIFCVVFLVYAKTIGFDYSYMDDNKILIDNKAIFEAKDVKRVFTMDAFLLEDNSSYYRPLQSLSFMADVAISGGLYPWMFHLTNILLFGVIGSILFLLLLKFNISPKISFLGVLIFCCHPIFVAAVAWIPARGDLLLTLFYILSFIFFKEFTEKREIKHLLLVWITFTFALFCKETAVLIPLVFGVFFFTMSPNRKIDRHCVLLGLSMGISGFVYLYLRILYTIPLGQIYLKDIFMAHATIPVAFSQIFQLPVDFSPLPTFSSTKIVVGLLVIILLFFLGYNQIKRNLKESLFYFLWFYILLFPNFLGLGISKIDYLDHRFLISMIGILLFILSLFPTTVKGSGKIDLKRSDFIWVGVAIALCIVSLYRADVYKGPESYFGAVIRYSPSNRYLAYYNRGCWQLGKEGLLEALDDFNSALINDKEHPLAYHNRGVVKSRMGDLQGALHDFNQAIAYNNRDSYLNRGLLKVQMEDLTGALLDYNQAIISNPQNAILYLFRGSLKTQMEDLEGALHDLDSAILLNKSFADAYGDRGSVKGMMGNFEDALNDVNTAIHIDSVNIKAYHNRAVLYWGLGDFEKALQDCEKVLQLEPDNRWVIPLKEMILNKRYDHDE